MALKLFWSPISPPCRTVRLVLNTLKIKVELEDVDIFGKFPLPLELIKVYTLYAIVNYVFPLNRLYRVTRNIRCLH